MFMFWSKRTLLTRRLLKAKVRGEHETECETQENHNFIPYSNTSEINIRKCGSSSGINIGGGSCNNWCSTESPSSGSLSNRKNRRSGTTICCCGKKNCSSSRSCYGGLPSAGGGCESGGLKSKSGASAAAAAEEKEEEEEEEQEEKFCCFGEEGTSCCCITDSKKGSNLQPRYSPSNDYHHHHHQRHYQQQPSRRDDNDHHAPGIFSNEEHHQQNVDQTNVRLVRCKEILKSLKENQLEMLLAAIESYGADLSSCVLVPRRRKSGPPTMTPTSEDHPESIQMTPCSPAQSDRNPRCYPHRHHHHHHHHHHHSRRQRQGDQPVQRDLDQEENLPLDERVSTATTTTAATLRFPRGERNRSRNSGSTNEFQAEPHLLFCQIWRWPDLATTSELKRLPVCHSVEDPVYVCCNPYHWSRLCKPESPPPPYCLVADRLRPEDRAPSEGGGGGGEGEEICVEGYETLQGYERNRNSPQLTCSLTTNGEDVSEQREWCTLAYWELGGRVGRLYPVEPSTVNVFDSLLDGDGLCLATLAENHSSASPAIERTRSKIGLGLMLSQESDGVWAYNRSENPIFVNSPTLDDPESRTLLVYRVPPGFCLNIFDRAKTLNKQHKNHQQQGCCQGPPSQIGISSGPVDVNSVRISFAKGWGPKYSRQEVTSCPCWLEVLLAPCR